MQAANSDKIAAAMAAKTAEVGTDTGRVASLLTSQLEDHADDVEMMAAQRAAFKAAHDAEAAKIAAATGAVDSISDELMDARHIVTDSEQLSGYTPLIG
jgi:hypothetical protein